ncbi:MAG: VanZ family protein [Bacilli bacterium]|nr:VanZ family protein [Bacilli bacterium]
MKKFISLTCLLVWSITLVLILTFATDVAAFITDTLSSVYHIYIDSVDVEDINLNLQSDYKPNRYYPLQYEVKTKGNKYTPLKFENLTLEYLNLYTDGSFTTKEIEEDYAVGKIKITASYDLDFEKIIEIPIKKVYPDVMKLTAFTASVHLTTTTPQIGIPFYVYPQFNPDLEFTERSIEFTYDQEYLELRDTNCFVGKKEGTTTITATMKNGLSDSYEITITPAPIEVTEFDDVRFYYYESEDWDENTGIGYKSGVFYPILKLNGESLYTDFTITSSDKSIVDIGYIGFIHFKEVGDAVVTITLPNGFKKEYPVSVRNHINLPSFSCSTMNSDGVIEVPVRGKTEIRYQFPELSDDEYQYKKVGAKSNGKVNVAALGSNAFVITANELGETTITLYMDDGFSPRAEKTFKVRIVKNPNVLIQREFDFTKFVAKILGHMGLFMIEALIAFWALHTMHFKRHWLEGIIFIVIGLLVGFISEFIQLFMPKRNGAIKDVGIDMLGYMIGFGIAIAGFLIYKKIKKTKYQHEIKTAEHH